MFIWCNMQRNDCLLAKLISSTWVSIYRYPAFLLKNFHTLMFFLWKTSIKMLYNLWFISYSVFRKRCIFSRTATDSLPKYATKDLFNAMPMYSLPPIGLQLSERPTAALFLLRRCCKNENVNIILERKNYFFNTLYILSCNSPSKTYTLFKVCM